MDAVQAPTDTDVQMEKGKSLQHCRTSDLLVAHFKLIAHDLVGKEAEE